MTRIVGNVLLPNGDLATKGIVIAKLNKQMIVNGKLYHPVSQSFPISSIGKIDFELAPNEGANIQDAFYYITVDVGGARFESTLFVRNTTSQVYNVTTSAVIGPDFVRKDDPTYQTITADLNANDILDVFEQDGMFVEAIDFLLFDGIEQTFQTTYEFVPESTKVWVNGLLQDRGIDNPGDERDYFEGTSNQEFTLTIAPESVDSVAIEYTRA